MAGLHERTNPYGTPTVSLAPVSDDQVTDANLEPPFVRVRSGNESFVYADSEARADVTDPSTYVLGGGDFQFYVRKMQRIAFEGLQANLSVPNINERNNTVIFHSTTSGLDHTVVVPEGIYTTAAAAAGALVSAMNLAPSGILFTAVVNPANALQVTLLAAGGTFHFIVGNPASTMMTRGRYLFNLPQEQTDTASKTMGAVFLQYTRFFDIISYSYTEYSKNPNTSNDHVPNALLARVFLAPPGPLSPTTGLQSNGVGFFTTDVNVSTNYNRSRALEVLDIRLVDEFGMPLYQPSLSSGSPPNAAITYILKTEL